jgi:hypothetical protein
MILLHPYALSTHVLSDLTMEYEVMEMMYTDVVMLPQETWRLLP